MKFLAFLILAFGYVSAAFAQDELDFLVGDWSTLDGPFRSNGLRISSNEDGTLNLKYCDLWKLRTIRDCELRHSYEGTIELDGQSIKVTESVGSPNPTYSLAKVLDTTNKFVRKWGNQNIVYRRIQ